MELGSSGVAFALQHATMEGKITIGTLVVFSLVSWTVILNKVWQLRRARKRNERFLAAYSEGQSTLDVHASVDKRAFGGSTLFDVYTAGCEELEKQMVKYGGKLPSHGLAAVRVSLERAMAEGASTLESGMVILATAISGGPFVGLLGTVWGVMDTFSGIARAGQANLTAMAPGVAAALIATVAGLLVAIPSLFAYNYLLTKIREQTMEVDNFGAHLDTVFGADYSRAADAGTLDLSDAHVAHETHGETFPMTGSPHPGVA